MKHYNTLNRLSDTLLSNLVHLVSHWSVHNCIFRYLSGSSVPFLFPNNKNVIFWRGSRWTGFSTVIEDIDFDTMENIHSGKVVIYINRLISDQKMIWSILRRLKTNHLTQLKMKTIKKFMISLKSVKLIITTSKLVWNLISRFRKICTNPISLIYTQTIQRTYFEYVKLKLFSRKCSFHKKFQ